MSPPPAEAYEASVEILEKSKPDMLIAIRSLDDRMFKLLCDCIQDGLEAAKKRAKSADTDVEEQEKNILTLTVLALAHRGLLHATREFYEEENGI